MKLLNYVQEGKVCLGIKQPQGIIDVKKEVEKYSLTAPITMEEVILRGEEGRNQLQDLISKDVQLVSEENITYAPCIMNPEKILCVGFNYLSHTEECNTNVPTVPVIFSKFNNAITAHKQAIKLPKTAEKFDYEAELVVIIGKEASNVSREEALSYVLGYTTGNDFSARDLQFRTAQWLIGKTCDNFAPIGPYIATADEINPNNLDISCSVNGVIRQSANTRDMIFDCAAIISYVSQYMTLKPGDLIFTGTPSGVILGYPEEQQQWLKPGDEIVVTIEGIGSLLNSLKS